MSTKIEVNAMGDACPLPVVKTLKALKQLDGEGTVVTSVDNETAVKNISKMGEKTPEAELPDGPFPSHLRQSQWFCSFVHTIWQDAADVLAFPSDFLPAKMEK